MGRVVRFLHVVGIQIKAQGHARPGPSAAGKIGPQAGGAALHQLHQGRISALRKGPLPVFLERGFGRNAHHILFAYRLRAHGQGIAKLFELSRYD